MMRNHPDSPRSHNRSSKDAIRRKVSSRTTPHMPRENPMRLLRFACIALATLLVACSPSPDGPARSNATVAPATAPPETAPDNAHFTQPNPPINSQSPDAMAQRAGITCEQAPITIDSKGCTVKISTNGPSIPATILPACGINGLFAAIATHSPLESKGIPDGQFVCAQAMAQSSNGESYYFVAGLNPSEVSICNDDATCKRYEKTSNCKLGLITENCGPAWIEEKALEIFSEGIGSQSN